MDQPKKTIFFEHLDSIRGIAFFLVFLWHVFGYLNYSPSTSIENAFVEGIVRKGHFGVNLFFVLSGFLISYLLITEKETTSRINVPFFYMRRILRIWPLYFLVLFISFFAYPLLTHQFSFADVKSHALYYVSFLNNFDRINTGFVGVGNDNLGVLWSIAVEEQFYFFWPLILAALNKKYYPFLFLFIITATFIFRTIYIEQGPVIYLHTFSVMSDLAVGSLLAYTAIYRNKIFAAIENLSRPAIITLYLLMISLFVFHKQWSELNQFTMVIERFVLSVFFAFMIGEQCFSKNSLFKLGNLKLLGKVGLISYGLYCLHLYSIVLVQKLNAAFSIQSNNALVFYAEFALCFAISLLISYFSFRYFEKKILALRGKFTVIRTR